MTFPINEAIDLDGAETIKIGKESFQIPVPLAFRQTMKIVPLISKVQAMDAAGVSQAPGEDNLDALARIVWIGLTRAYPSMTFEAFLDLPMTFAELIAAAPVVIRATRAVTLLEPGEVLVGEATAAS